MLQSVKPRIVAAVRLLAHAAPDLLLEADSAHPLAPNTLLRLHVSRTSTFPLWQSQEHSSSRHPTCWPSKHSPLMAVGVMAYVPVNP